MSGRRTIPLPIRFAVSICIAGVTVVALPGGAGAESPPPTTTNLPADTPCPSTAPFKISIGGGLIQCWTLSEFCVAAVFREECAPGATSTTLAPGQTRAEYSDDSIELVGAARRPYGCPVSNPVQVSMSEGRILCYTLLGYCETMNPTWYDPDRGLYCPGSSTTTTTSPPSLRGAPEPAAIAPTAARTGSSVRVETVRAEASIGAVGSPATTSTVVIRATKPGSRPVLIVRRVASGRAATIETPARLAGYRMEVFVDGVSILVIPATRRAK